MEAGKEPLRTDLVHRTPAIQADLHIVVLYSTLKR